MQLSEKDTRELRRGFEDFMKVPFPRLVIDEEETRKLHMDLLEYDAYAAGLISSLSKGVDVDPERLVFGDALKDRLEAFGRERPAALAFVEEHLRYLEVLHRLVGIGKDRMVKN